MRSISNQLSSRLKLAFRLYDLAWRCALPWLRLNPRLSEGFRQRILKTGPPAADLWVQAASAGEAYLAIEIVKSLKPANAVNVLVTSNTRQGIEILSQELAGGEFSNGRVQSKIGYFPFDKPAIMREAVSAIEPKVMVLLETEIWPGLLHSLKSQHCRIFIVNGRITEKSLKRYLLWPSIWQKIRPDRILAISRPDARRFAQLFGNEGIEVMSNIKFDRIAPAKSHGRNENTVRTVVPAEKPFIVLASVRHAEAHLIKKTIERILRIRPQAVIGLFPRHMHRIRYWQKTFQQAKIRYILRSKAAGRVLPGTVILWDTFGELLPAYQVAQSAFVGGSLAPLGGQNFLEALISGIIPIIGPWWENFAWVGEEIIDSGLLRVAGGWKEVAAFLIDDMDSRPSRGEVTGAALQFIKAHRGGTETACRLIGAYLDGN